MMQELIDRIKKIQDRLAEGGVGLEKLEKLEKDARDAFAGAIDSLVSKRDLLEELKRRREEMKKWRRGIWKTFFPISLKYVLSMPFIYGMFFPVIIFHFCLEIYHQVCFRLYGIPQVDRKKFFIYDRQLLPYLNWFEKFNCIYCSYVNNLFAYAVEIGGRTERYWCPIKYHRRLQSSHSQYVKFVDYLDAENFRGKWKELRNFTDVKDEDGKA